MIFDQTSSLRASCSRILSIMRSCLPEVFVMNKAQMRLGQRDFSHIEPAAWNGLPLQQISIAIRIIQASTKNFSVSWRLLRLFWSVLHFHSFIRIYLYLLVFLLLSFISFLSASLYVSKRGAYWDRRVVTSLVGWSLVVTRVHCGQTVHPRPIVTMEH